MLVYMYVGFIIPEVIAWFDEIHAIVTVWHGVLSEKPAPRAAYEEGKRPSTGMKIKLNANL